MRRLFGTRRGLLLKSYNTGAAAVWPFGTDGVLHVTNGQNISIGSNKDYSSITIDVGGTLNVNVPSGTPLSIGCSGSTAINGTLNCRANVSAGTLTATAPDGTSLSYTVTRKNGGAGGKGPAIFGASGGAQSGGYGGGGGSNDGAGSPAGGGQGGNGANGSDQFGTVQGGSGWMDVADPNTAGANANSDACCNGCLPDATGAGGGGSNPGTQGGMVYLKVVGNLSGNGSVNLSGNNGNAGSKGGDASAITNLCVGGPNAYGGGGGGGGAGGSGGKWMVRYHGTNTFSGTVSVAGGTKGTAGAGGTAVAVPGSAFAGADAGAAQDGNAGSQDVAAY